MPTFIHLDADTDNYPVEVRIDAIEAIVDRGEGGIRVHLTSGTQFGTRERIGHFTQRLEGLTR